MNERLIKHNFQIALAFGDTAAFLRRALTKAAAAPPKTDYECGWLDALNEVAGCMAEAVERHTSSPPLDDYIGELIKADPGRGLD